ncbi:MAG: Holliday junction resolvase RuvX [Cyclobacteriaceae bacterium]
MGRILAIDYGKKRCGIAVTDPLRMIASPLETVKTESLYTFLQGYTDREEVDVIVFGMPTDLKSRDTHITADVRKSMDKCRTKFPEIQIDAIDERFTSKIAFDSMIAGGLGKKKRADKERLDKVSAAVILQSYLEQNS